MSDLRVRLLLPDEPSNWPAELLGPATFTVLDAWTSIARSNYAFPVHRLETEQESGVNGILSLVEIKHPLLGHYLTTSPFGSYGGFAFSSPEARDALLARARQLGDDLGAEYVNVRFAPPSGAGLGVGLPTSASADEPPEGWVQDPVYATYLMDLASDPESLMPNFSSDHRNHIRKSLKKGFAVKFGHLDLLDDAYEGLARSMHELGSPYHSKAYLQSMAVALGDALEFVVLYGPKSKIAGAGVFIARGSVVTNLHANILRRYRSNYAGEFLYWKVIERYCQKGFQTFDIGRSLIGSGNETFKLKWKPRKQLLAYWYALKPGGELPHINQKSPRFRFAIAMWKILPAFIVRPLGPFLIRGLA
ncbi:MAG: GNAT family N-acetyltransferase [Anaerolineales bacterium]